MDNVLKNDMNVVSSLLAVAAILISVGPPCLFINRK